MCYFDAPDAGARSRHQHREQTPYAKVPTTRIAQLRGRDKVSSKSENEIGREDLELRKLEYELSIRRLQLEEKKIEPGVQLTQYGLKGTLTGAICGVVLVIVLALLGSFLPNLGITGLHITIIIGIICITVGIYGAFVFNRSASVAGRIGDNEFKAGTTDGDKRGGEQKINKRHNT